MVVQNDPFGRPAQQAGGKSVDFLEISQNVNNVAARLRVLEDRYGNLRKKLQLTDDNMLTFQKNVSAQVKQMQSKLEDLQRSLADAMQKVERMTEELKNTVKETDFRVIEKFLDAWQPLDFVTRRELEALLEERRLQER